MINLLQELLQLTDEEQELLQNKNKIIKDIYTNQAEFIIECEKFLPNNKMIMVRKHTRFVEFPKHKHNYIEINYVYHGVLNQKIGNNHVTLHKGELLFLNQHVEHEIEACSKEDIVINFIIQPRFFEFIFSFLDMETKISSFFVNSLYNNTQEGQVLFYKVAEIEEIQILIQKIILEIYKPTFTSESTIKLSIGLLLVELVKHAERSENIEMNSIDHSLVVESLKYIHTDYKEASLYELANQLKQPHYSLSKLIKLNTGYTFKELLQDRRLNVAQELLSTTGSPVTIIAERVGYENISYFYKIYKKKFGKTPQIYRKLIKNVQN